MNINESNVINAINILHPNNELYEARVIGQENGYKKIYSGYFKGSNELVKCLKKCNVIGNVYITLNYVKDSCYAREQKDRLIKANNTTEDTDIMKRQYLFIDFDPKRETGISSSEKEKQLAYEKLHDVYKYLKGCGFNEPIAADSGNGYHLLYKVDIPNEKDGIIKRVLQRLDELFTDENIDIDVKVSNAARICKLYGTYACKGSHTEDRPHRMSKILFAPDGFHENPNTLVQLEKIAIPEDEQDEKQYNNSFGNSVYDVKEFIQKHNIQIKETKVLSDRTIYVLNSCLFDPSHKGKDACIMQFNNGAKAYNCFHNSCRDKHWKQARLLFEPNAYDNNKKTYTKIESNPNSKKKSYLEEVLQSVDDTEPNLYDFADIPKGKENEYIQSGIKVLDEKQKGFAKGELTIVTGKRGAGKTTLLAQIILQAREQGCKTLWYNAEMKIETTATWVKYIASGHDYVIQSSNRPEDYNLSSDAEKLISDWLKTYIYIVNTKKDWDWSKLSEEIVKAIEEKKIDLIVIDNLMTIDLSYSSNDDQYNKQTTFIKNLVKIAQKYDIHIILVAHPRKQSQISQMLTADDIAGTGNLTNLAHNIIILHRVNQSFKNDYKIKYRLQQDDENCKSTNCIEIVKNRDTGRQDYFIPLYYDATCRQLQDAKQLNRTYSWSYDCGIEKTNENNWELETESDVEIHNSVLKSMIIKMISDVRKSDDGILKLVYSAHPKIFENTRAKMIESKNALFLNTFESIPEITSTTLDGTKIINRNNIAIEFGTVTEDSTDCIKKGAGVIIKDLTRVLDGEYTDESKTDNSDLLGDIFSNENKTQK